MEKISTVKDLIFIKDLYSIKKTLPGNCNGVMGLKLLPDGTLASVGWDSQLIIWDMSNSNSIFKTSTYGAGSGIILMPITNLVIVGTWFNRMQVFNISLTTNPLVQSITCDSFCSAFEFLTDRITLAESSGWVGGSTCIGTCTQIRLRNSASSFSIIKTLIGHNDAVYSLKLLSDGRLASASRDGTIKIWNTNLASGNELVLTIQNVNPYSGTLELLSDGTLACGSSQLNIYNVNTGQLIKTLGSTYSAILGLKLINSQYLAVASDYSRVDIMDLTMSGTNALVQSLYGMGSWATSVELLSDGQTLAAGSSDNGCANLLMYTSKV
jgi:WD40 repeat protein